MTKSKYAGLLEARMKEPENEMTEGNEPAKPAKRKATKKPSKRTAKQASSKAVKQASYKKGSPIVTITARVPEEKRIWWTIQATLERKTLTDALIEALDKRYGLPKKMKF